MTKKKIIQKPDGRLHAVAELAEDLILPDTVHKKGTSIIAVGKSKTRKGKDIWISIPNPTALYLSLSQKSYKLSRNYLKKNPLKKDKKNEYRFENPKYQNDYLEQAIATIIFAYTAIETFANEYIPKDYIYKEERKDKKCTEIYNKDQIERNVKLDIKLTKILPETLKIESIDKSKELWSQLKNLEDLRNRLIHLKEIDLKRSEHYQNTIWGKLVFDKHPYPHKVAFSVIKKYIDQLPSPPRWFTEMKV